MPCVQLFLREHDIATLHELCGSNARYSRIAILTFLLGCILGVFIADSQHWPSNYSFDFTKTKISRQTTYATNRIRLNLPTIGSTVRTDDIENVRAVMTYASSSPIAENASLSQAGLASDSAKHATYTAIGIVTSSHRHELTTHNEPTTSLMVTRPYTISQFSPPAGASTTRNHPLLIMPLPSTSPPQLNDSAAQQGRKSVRFRETLPSSKFSCPPLVRVDGWNGRIGNHFHSVAQSIVAAQLCGITTVHYPPHVIGKVYQQQDGLLEMPRKISLPGEESYAGRMIPSCCPKQFKQTFYHMPCTRIPAWYYREAYMSNAYKYIGGDVQRVITLPRTDFEDDHLLTIHMRGDDITHYPRYMWGQPPCSMYAKIIEDFNYKNVWLVRRGNSPCIKWLSSYAVKHGISVKNKEQSIAEDLGTLARAKNLVLSFSSFSVSAVLMSKEIRNIYRRRDAAWESILRAVINCAVWTGVKMFEYNSTVITKEDEKKTNPADWLVHFPKSKIDGPFLCDDGSEVGPSI
eukprot:TRINITY_DN10733_c0_g1_i1.p1 TRINITY_DN10733_c0_g1~~TRINITY_DN10733_c0_g1_i1.p1  ORF type:complete len:519 (-),score=20.79 TRINITY_DN10733_c0_g1_i1:260-1816(-)